MNILAIDTSGEYLSIGLQYKDKQFYILDKVGNKQSNFIIPKIDGLLHECGLSLCDIEAIAYNQGPGSFTGLRIGLSVAMGMAYPRNIKLIPLHGFVIYANSVKNIVTSKNVLVGLDARLNQIYLAGINIDTMQYFIEPHLVNPTDIFVPQDNYVCLGGGFKEYYSLLPDSIQRLDVIDIKYPNALNMLELINNGHGKMITANEADLLYLRNKVAMNLVEQKQAKLMQK